MLVAITNYSCYTSPSTPLTTWNGDVTGNIDISLKDARMNRTATFVANDGNAHTYESDVKAVVDHSQFYQTQNGGAYKKKGYLTASMWNAGAGTVTQNGNVDYTVRNLECGTAATTMYALYTAGSGKSVVNGDINLKFENNAASGFSAYGVNDAGKNCPQAELNGNLSLAISGSTMGSFYGAVNGRIDGNSAVAVTNSTVSTLAVLSGTAASITGNSSVLFSGANTVKSKINGFNDVALAKDAVMNITPSVAVNFAGTWSNEGSLVVDMTGQTTGRHTLVDNKGSSAMDLAAYGTVTLTNAEGFELKVIDNDLVAEKPVAQVVSADGTATNGFVTLQAAFDAVQANETIEVLANNSETITVTNTCSFTFKSNGYDLSGGSVTPAQGYGFTRVGDVCTYGVALPKVAQVTIGEVTAKYSSLANALELTKATKGAICTLLSDIDLTGESWTPIADFFGTLNGNGHTITGLSAELIASAGINEDFETRPTVISNLTISAANITTTGDGHGFVLGVSQPQVTITDVTVVDSSIESTGQYVGGIAGKGYPEISDCVVSNCTVKGIEQVGGVMGYAAVPQILRCSVVGATTIEACDRAGGIIGKFQCDGDEGDPCYLIDNSVACTVKATGNEDGDKRAGGLIGQIMGDIALYEITGNFINVTFAGDAPTTNPIGSLRSGQNATFTGALAANIAYNWWEDVTLNANSFTYTDVGEGVDPQTISRMKSPKVTVTMDVNPAFLAAEFGGNTGLSIIEGGAAAYGYAWDAETKSMTLAQKFTSLSEAEQAFLGVFGVQWDATAKYWKVQDASAPFAAEEVRKAANGAKPVLNVTFGVAGTLKAPPSIQDTGCEDLYKTLGACWLMTPVDVSVIGKGDDATISPPEVSSTYWPTAKVAGGAEANFVANGKLFVSNLTFSATGSFSITADCAPKSGVSSVVDVAEVEIVDCRLGGQLYPYGNFDNRGKLVYNIHHCTFDGSSSSTTYAFFAQSTSGGGRDIGALNFCSNTVAGYPRGISIQNQTMRCRVIGNAITPGTGYSAVQATNLESLEIAGNAIAFTGANGGNVLTVHESLYNQSLQGVTIDVHDNVISGTGFAIYDDICKEKGDYDTDVFYALTWRGNTLADAAAMALASGAKGAKTYAVSTYVRSVIDPAAFIVRKDAFDNDVTNFYGTLVHALGNVQEGETVELLRDNAEQLELTLLVPAFRIRSNGVKLTGSIEPADGYKFVVDQQAGTCEYAACRYVAQWARRSTSRSPTRWRPWRTAARLSSSTTGGRLATRFRSKRTSPFLRAQAFRRHR